MFYSHEILTSQKYGVATVWLVATVGTNSSTSKVNKKQILNVNVAKACDTIIHPEAPMALRLQSSLLYGVSKVYNQQCGYVLSDAQAAQNNLRALFKIVKNNTLDADPNVQRPDQLMILDDPAFLAEIPALDFDFNDFDNALNVDSQHSLISSVRSRSGSGTQHDSSQHSMLQLQIPSSAPRGTPAYQLPPMPFGSSAHKTPSAGYGGGLGSNSYDEDGMGLLDELDFEFDADGGMVEGDAEERARVRSGAAPRPRNYAGVGRTDSAASDRVRLELEEALAGRMGGLGLDEDGDFMMHMDDDNLVLPDAEAFQPLQRDKPEASEHLTSELTEVLTSETAEIPVKRRKAKAAIKKAITDTESISYRNADFKIWQESYVENMEAKRAEKRTISVRNHAKANADVFLWGNGIGGIGRILSSVDNASGHPLAWLQGDMLKQLIMGEESDAPQQRKRRHSTASTIAADEEPNKRHHSDNPEMQRAGEDEDMLGAYADEALQLIGDDTAEIGREAPEPLAEYQSSAMPWNVSSSLNSYRAGSSSLPRGRAGVRGSSVVGNKPGPPSRVSAQSPLVGRGRILSDFEDLGRDGTPSPPGRGGEQYTSDNAMLAIDDEEFELHGPGAAVDTQTAGNSQWLAEALETESYNFLGFVKNTATEIEIDEEMTGRQAEDVEGEEGEGKTWVGFEKMFPPNGGTTKIVAAQAFYHVLSLATKNLLGVKQDAGGGEIGEEVRMFVKSGVAA